MAAGPLGGLERRHGGTANRVGVATIPTWDRRRIVALYRLDISLFRKTEGSYGASCTLDARDYSIYAMTWGTVELEPEVEEWLLSLSDADFGHAAFYVDLLADRGPLLDEPYTK